MENFKNFVTKNTKKIKEKKDNLKLSGKKTLAGIIAAATVITPSVAINRNVKANNLYNEDNYEEVLSDIVLEDSYPFINVTKAPKTNMQLVTGDHKDYISQNKKLNFLNNIMQNNEQTPSQQPVEPIEYVPEHTPVEEKPVTPPQITNPVEPPIEKVPVEQNPIVSENYFKSHLNLTSATNTSGDVSMGTKLIVQNSAYEIPEALRENLENAIKDTGYTVGLYVKSGTSSMTLSNDCDRQYYAASTMKAVFGLYVMKEIERGNITLDDTLTYTKDCLYAQGSGIIKNSAVGTEFKLRDVLYNLCHYSDGCAFLMLKKAYGYDGVNEMLADLGCKSTYSPENTWGYISSKDLNLVWQEIEAYKNFDGSMVDEKTGKKYGQFWYDILVDAKYSRIAKAFSSSKITSHKSGSSSKSCNDSGSVYGDDVKRSEVYDTDDMYTMTLMLGTNGNAGTPKAFINITKCIDAIMEDYKEFYAINSASEDAFACHNDINIVYDTVLE